MGEQSASRSSTLVGCRDLGLPRFALLAQGVREVELVPHRAVAVVLRVRFIQL
jgi:hypothetical protein